MGKPKLFALALLSVLLAAQASLGNALILQVPDWDQPDNYAAGEPLLNVGDYPNWCSPTASANIMGYWEDTMGKTGLADGAVSPASSGAFPANAGTWKQGLWHDGTVEIGWFYDTGKWQSFPRGFPPLNGLTNTANTPGGLQTYVSTGWTDTGGAITKTAYQATTTADQFNVTALATMWSNYVSDIDNSLPVLVSFDMWVTNPTGVTHTVNGQSVSEYLFGAGGAHCTTGVGYLDPDATPGTGDEWFIVQDNWPSTPQYVAVPLIDPTWGANYTPPDPLGPTVWRQNVYLTVGDEIPIPEPATLSLLAFGTIGFIARRRRR